MATHSIKQPVNADAANRSQIYALFAEALSFPQEDGALRLLNGDWAGELDDGLALIDGSEVSEDDVGQLPRFQSVEELQNAYSNLFDVTSGTPKVSLLERRYRDTPEQALWRELLGFYSHFGLDFSEGYAEEQIDHLLTELSFMHYLCFLEAGAKNSTADLLRGERDFLRLHLHAFADGFGQAINDTDGADYYASIADRLVRFIDSEVNFLTLRLDESTDQSVISS